MVERFSRYHVISKHNGWMQFYDGEFLESAEEYAKVISTLRKVTDISIIPCPFPEGSCDCYNLARKEDIKNKIKADLEGHLKLLETIYDSETCLTTKLVGLVHLAAQRK